MDQERLYNDGISYAYEAVGPLGAIIVICMAVIVITSLLLVSTLWRAYNKTQREAKQERIKMQEEAKQDWKDSIEVMHKVMSILELVSGDQSQLSDAMKQQFSELKDFIKDHFHHEN